VAKTTWGIKHKAMATIYKGAILPLLSYGIQIWHEAMKYEHNRKKYIQVQRLINICMAKAYRTTSSEALCVITGMTPIIIKLEEVAQCCKAQERTGKIKMELDHDVEFKNWPHPADAATIEEIKSDEYATILTNTEGNKQDQEVAQALEYKRRPQPAEVAAMVEETNQEEQTLQIYTDGSKNDQGVEAGVAIFSGQKLIIKRQYKLDSRCSNNQAEQLAIAKALETLETIEIEENNSRMATILTDSRISLDAIKNGYNHSHLTEEIRKSLIKLERSNWTIKFAWVKAHAGILGNELADQLAKTAAQSKRKEICYNRIPLSTLYRELEVKSRQKWQKHWDDTPKAAITKQFYPRITERLKSTINVTANFSAIVSGHGKTRSYLHRFKIMKSAECLCKNGDQTTDHLLYRCTLLQRQRETLKKDTQKD
jgi:ribonuclease HI